MEKQLSREMLEVIFQIPTQMRKLDTQGVLRFLMQKIVEVLKVERISVYEVFEEFEEFRLILGEPEGKHGIGQILRFSEFLHHTQAIETKTYLQKEEPGLDPDIRQGKELIYTEGITAWLIIPLLIENEAEWLMVVDAKWPRKDFSEEEIFFCMYLGNQVGLLLERDRMQKIKDEREVTAEIGEMAAEAYHKLRNPIQYTYGFARRLQKLTENEGLCETCKGKKYAQAIMKGVIDLEKTVNGLLKFVRPRKAVVCQTNINDIISKICQSFEGVPTNKEIKVGLNLDERLLPITADPTDIEEMISHVLYNAFEAIEGKGEIRIKSRQDNGWIRIVVSNNGGCIDEEILRQIFNPFFTTKEGGRGMGLAITQRIVKAYDGTIKVENERERNLTSFIIKLPIGSEAAR